MYTAYEAVVGATERLPSGTRESLVVSSQVWSVHQRHPQLRFFPSHMRPNTCVCGGGERSAAHRLGGCRLIVDGRLSS